MEEKKYWITFRVSLPNGVVEGDLSATTEKLNEEFFRNIKTQVALGITKQNGGVVIPEMGEPIILSCILLDE